MIEGFILTIESLGIDEAEVMEVLVRTTALPEGQAIYPTIQEVIAMEKRRGMPDDLGDDKLKFFKITVEEVEYAEL